MKIFENYECMAFEDCPAELLLSAVDLNKKPIDFDTIGLDDIVCIRRCEL